MESASSVEGLPRLEKIPQSGTVLHESFLNDGRRLIIRVPLMDDTRGFIKVVHDIGDEIEKKTSQRPINVAEESLWMRSRLDRVSRGEVLFLLAEIDGEIVGYSRLIVSRPENPQIAKTASELNTSGDVVWEIGLGVLENYRRLGIATLLHSKMMFLAKESGVKLVYERVHKDNVKMFGLLKIEKMLRAGDSTNSENKDFIQVYRAP